MEKNEIVKATPQTPMELIQVAVAGGADLTQLEKLLELQFRFEANEARKAYHKAMADFKVNAPEIKKDKKVSYLKVKYSHASLANIVEKITAELSKHGLSATWRPKQNGAISITCIITHSMGHSEETTLTATADSSGSKNSIQAIGSTITYLERYTLLAATGLATGDDDDGQASAPEEESKIDENKLKIINTLLESTKSDKAQFLKYLEVDKIEDLPKSKFIKAKVLLETRAKEMTK